MDWWKIEEELKMVLVLACAQKALLYHYRDKTANDAFVRLNAGCTRVCSLFNRNRELPSCIRDRGDPFSRGLRCLANQQSGDLQSILISRVIPLHQLRDKVLQHSEKRLHAKYLVMENIWSFSMQKI